MYLLDSLRLLSSAEGETRTRTLLPAADFESAASTNSATPARCRGAYSTKFLPFGKYFYAVLSYIHET